MVYGENWGIEVKRKPSQFWQIIREVMQALFSNSMRAAAAMLL
jgi:hypothetical protein